MTAPNQTKGQRKAPIYPCQKLGCDAPGTRWLQFGTVDSFWSYCAVHATALLAQRDDFEDRDRPTDVTRRFTAHNEV